MHDRPTITPPLKEFVREWMPLFGLALALMVVMMTWISCSPHINHAESIGRYQMLLDGNGQVIVLDTATGETWVQREHSKQRAP